MNLEKIKKDLNRNLYKKDSSSLKDKLYFRFRDYSDLLFYLDLYESLWESILIVQRGRIIILEDIKKTIEMRNKK